MGISFGEQQKWKTHLQEVLSFLKKTASRNRLAIIFSALYYD